MPRIRTIKPEFPQSESMGKVSRDARLTFVQMWTLADDSGRLRGNSRMLASLLYPYDDDAPSLIDGWLEELERENCILRYQSKDGGKYIQIKRWLEHQKIDKPSVSRIPDPDSSNPRESSRILANPRERSSLDLGPRTKEGTRDQGGEGKGKAAVAAAPSQGAPSLEEVREYAQEAGLSNFDPERFFYYYKANGWKQGGGKEIVDWKAAAHSWIEKETQFAGKSKSRAGPLKGADLVDSNRDVVASFNQKVANGTVANLFSGFGNAGGGDVAPNHGANAGGLQRRLE